MTKRPIRHRVVRTKNKHSRAVLQNNTIIIRLARGLSQIEEMEHVNDLLRRMTDRVLEDRKKKLIDPFRPLLEGARTCVITLATGRKIRFELTPGKHLRKIKKGSGWVVEVGPRTRRRALHAFLWEVLSESEADRLCSLTDRLNDEHYNTYFRLFRLKFASTQWGSCSSKDVIMINTALLFVPPSVLKYVIIHELAHLFHPDHSDAYWRKVEQAMPGYRSARKKLLEYRLPTL